MCQWNHLSNNLWFPFTIFKRKFHWKNGSHEFWKIRAYIDSIFEVFWHNLLVMHGVPTKHTTQWRNRLIVISLVKTTWTHIILNGDQYHTVSNLSKPLLILTNLWLKTHKKTRINQDWQHLQWNSQWLLFPRGIIPVIIVDLKNWESFQS